MFKVLLRRLSSMIMPGRGSREDQLTPEEVKAAKMRVVEHFGEGKIKLQGFINDKPVGNSIIVRAAPPIRTQFNHRH